MRQQGRTLGAILTERAKLLELPVVHGWLGHFQDRGMRGLIQLCMMSNSRKIKFQREMKRVQSQVFAKVRTELNFGSSEDPKVHCEVRAKFYHARGLREPKYEFP